MKMFFILFTSLCFFIGISFSDVKCSENGILSKDIQKECDTIFLKDTVIVRDTIFKYYPIGDLQSNIIAIIEVEAELRMIEWDMKSNLLHSMLPEALEYMERLSGIGFKTGGDFTGPYRPKDSDYKKWRDWFEKNKHRLYWDEKEQMVKLKE